MLRGLIKAARPHQWVKNLFVLAPLVFAKGLDQTDMVARSVIAFIAFSFAASSIYLLNDIADVEADRAHPIKKNRPIASGVVSEKAARILMFVLATLALGISAGLGLSVAGTIGGYLLLNVAYTYKLKQVPYVDVLCIAAGFELRVLCGTFALDVPPTIYLLIITLLLSMFLGFGKRMHELQTSSSKGRKVLSSYNTKTLSVLLQLTALATTGTYVVYTLDPATREVFGTDYLAASIVFTEFGVIRFMDMVRHKDNSESPTEQMLRDWPFILNLFLWAVAVVVIIYFT